MFFLKVQWLSPRHVTEFLWIELLLYFPLRIAQERALSSYQPRFRLQGRDVRHRRLCRVALFGYFWENSRWLSFWDSAHAVLPRYQKWTGAARLKMYAATSQKAELTWRSGSFPALGWAVDEREHWELCLYPYPRPSIFSTKQGRRCQPSRRDGIKDVLLNQLIIMHLHMRTCNLYPSNLLLLRLLWHFVLKLIFSKPTSMEGTLEWSRRVWCYGYVCI